MDFTKDPNDRRRVDAETQRYRDAEIARLRAANPSVPFRTIAERFGMSLGAVQKAVSRYQKLSEALATGQPGRVVAAITDDELAAEDVRTPEDVARLNLLELYRLRFIPGLPDDVRMAVAIAWAALPRPATVYPIDDGVSWREHCDAAIAGNSGTDDDW